MNPEPADEIDLSDMNRLVSGHDAALNDLMDRHQLRLFQYLVRSLQNEAEAEDMAQETFVRVYQNRTRFDPQQKFSTWLYTIASNLVRNRYRWRTRHPQVSLDAENEGTGTSFGENLPDARPSPGEMMLAEEQGEIVRRAIAGLPEKLRTPLILAEYENQSSAEIAEVLGCTSKAAETRIARARQQLRNSLGKLLKGTISRSTHLNPTTP